MEKVMECQISGDVNFDIQFKAIKTRMKILKSNYGFAQKQYKLYTDLRNSKILNPVTCHNIALNFDLGKLVHSHIDNKEWSAYADASEREKQILIEIANKYL